MDYISFTEYQEIIKNIKNRKLFQYEKEISKIEINIYSSTAQCDWTNSEVKEGDYTVHLNLYKKYGNYRACGSPYSVREFQGLFGSYELIVRYINDWILKNSDTVKIRLSEQLSLF